MEKLQFICAQPRSLYFIWQIEVLINNFIIPKEHQKEVLEKSKNFFTNNNIGRLNWSCGLGKSLMSLFIVKELKFKTVIIGVPSKNLQSQSS